MLKKVLGISAMVAIVLVGIYYPNFLKQDLCLDAGGIWSREQQTCRTGRGRDKELPEWMAKYVVIDPEPDPSGELAPNGVDEHRRDAPSNAQ